MSASSACRRSEPPSSLTLRRLVDFYLNFAEATIRMSYFRFGSQQPHRVIHRHLGYHDPIVFSHLNFEVIHWLICRAS